MKCRLFIVLLIATCTARAQSPSTAVLSDSLFWYKLHMSTDTAKGICTLKSITITSKANAGKVQEIVIKGAGNNEIACDTANLNKSSSDDFIIEDVDFDGYNDLRFIITPRSADDRNAGYSYWRYNSTKQLFEKDLALDTAGLNIPTFDHAAKQVNTYDEAGGTYPDRSHSSAIYEYRKGRLTEVSSESVELNTNSKGQKYTVTEERQLVNGKMKLISKKIDLVDD